MQLDTENIILLATLAFICGACLISSYLFLKAQRSWKCITMLVSSLILTGAAVWVVYSYSRMRYFMEQLTGWTNYPALGEFSDSSDSTLTPWEKIERYSDQIVYGGYAFIFGLLMFTFALVAFAATYSAQQRRHEETLAFNKTLQEKLSEQSDR